MRAYHLQFYFKQEQILRNITSTSNPAEMLTKSLLPNSNSTQSDLNSATEKPQHSHILGKNQSLSLLIGSKDRCCSLDSWYCVLSCPHKPRPLSTDLIHIVFSNSLFPLSSFSFFFFFGPFTHSSTYSLPHNES